jgi:hypothetical protein
MKQFFLTIAFAFAYVLSTKAQVLAPAIQWETSLGTDSTDNIVSTMVDQHGHIYLLGYSEQWGINGDKSYAKGDLDIWLMKLDANGQKLWDTVYGGSGTDAAIRAIEHDGEILINGATTSKDGDISDTIGKGGHFDAWLLKIDANGKKIWDKRIGTSGSTGGKIIRVQNGYIWYSGTLVVDGDRSIPITYGDWLWVVKLNNNGVKQWERSFGINPQANLIPADLIPTNDGGSLLINYTKAGIGGDKTDTARGGYDMWLIKLDANGQKMWDVTLGNPNDDLVNAMSTPPVVQCPDGTYIYANNSFGGNGGDKTSGYIDGGDIWVVKLDANGQKLWDKTIGTNQIDFVGGIAATVDNGIIIASRAEGPANHDKSEDSKGESDMWLIRMDANGNILWDKIIGGDKHDGAYSIVNLGSNGTVVVGASYSGISGDKSSANRGYSDLWVVKLGPEQVNGIDETAHYPQLFNAYPNPVRGHIQFTQTADVQIISLDGKRLLSAQEVDQVSVAHLSSGVYLLQYKAPNSSIWQSVQMMKE